ncbi:putative heme steroid binding protein [Botrytis fragariae]|uniref:Putative heme steroid binding protein n=1 Tax=Botrytis fragariae TaxID=1964551 RepID=A0A8H6AJ67_9HELO|nr:putative heme steroid binding protein [Botrytis fragariae]KAF5868228.1 putative heme steroid binding protein [Botrytis fragariae]
MVLLGLGLLIASVSFLYYKHAPAGWWTFLERLNLRAGGSIQDGDRNRDRDADGKGEEGKEGKDGKKEDSTPRIIGVEGQEKEKEDKVERSSTSSPPSNTTTNAPTQKSTTANNAPTFQISAPSQTPSMQPPSPPPSKAALDRAAMPPPPPLFKKSTPTPKPKTKTPSSPTTPRAHASQPPQQTPNIPIFSLNATNSPSTFPDLESEPESEPEIPSFPAANSAQRASNTGSRVPPRLNPLPAFKSTSTSTPASLSTPTRGPLPLPNRSPLPNRNPSSLAAPSLAPPPTHTSIPSKPRKKVLLTPNHSPLDWARLTSSPNSNLRNLPPSTPLLRVPPSLLKQFTGRKGKDAWTVLGGKVYNITPYLPYHPGGEPELLKCAGRDGTRLFGEVHPWVNWEGMLEACLVGISVGEEEFEGVGGLEDMD